MALWPCGIRGCEKLAVRILGECKICRRRLCTVHVDSDLHQCPPREDAEAYYPLAQAAERREIAELIDLIDTGALLDRISTLCPDVRCEIPEPKYHHGHRNSFMGENNFHFDINFDDGNVWLVRVRRCNVASPPRELQNYTIESEVATLKFLEKIGAPTPRVHDYELDHPDNPIGVGFIIMDKLPGKPMHWNTATAEQKSRLMGQLADFFAKLREHSFDTVGCLRNPELPQVGPSTRTLTTHFVQQKGADGQVNGSVPPAMHTMGPWKSVQDSLEAPLDSIMNGIVRGEHAPPKKAEDYYLIHRFLKDVAPQLGGSAGEDKKYYLKHADDRGDHILVDDDFNLTGIVDWEGAHVTSPKIAFKSPIAFLPIEGIFSGDVNMSEDEVAFAHVLEQKNQSELARYVCAGRAHHFFSMCMGYPISDWEGIIALFNGVREATGVDKATAWNEWRSMAIDRYKHDSRMSLLRLIRNDSESLQVE